MFLFSHFLPKRKSKAHHQQEDKKKDVDFSQKTLSKKLSLLFLLIDIIIIVFNPFELERISLKSLVSNISIVLITIFLTLLASSNRLRTDCYTLLLTGLVTLHFIWFVESFAQGGSKDKNYQLILLGSYLQMLQTTMAICRLKLKYYTIWLMSLSAYNFLRVNEAPFSLAIISIPYHLSYTIFNLVSCWIIERLETKKKSNEVYYKRFKTLLDNFPAAFLITSKEKIVYNNKSWEKYLHSKNPFPFFSKIKILLKDQSLRSLTNDNGSELLMSEQFNEPTNILNENFLENTNLNDLLNTFEKEKSEKGKEATILTCFGIFTNKSGVSDEFLECTVSNIDWEDELMQLITISESKIFKKFYESKRENERKDKQIANVCHDLRTPLNGIMGILNLIMDLASGNEIKNLITMANHSARHLLFIINDLLDSNQLANDKLRLNLENFKLEESVRSVVEFLIFQARAKNIEINLINKLDNRVVVKSDPNRLKQVLINLIGNAIKFTEKGRVDVIIESNKNFIRGNIFQNNSGSFINENHYWIRVVDTGCGINVEDISNLFVDFAIIRNEVTTRLNKHGIGLGLSISQKIINALNNHRKEARIRVSSTLGQGSEFYFPLYSWDEDNLRSTSDGEYSTFSEFETSRRDIHADYVKLQSYNFLPNNFSQSNGLRILIVDDDQINLIVLSHYLVKWKNPLIDKCTDGLSALQKIKENAIKNIFFDAIIIDNKMPIMDGVETIKEIRKLIEEGTIKEIAIIGASGDLASLDEFKLAGADEHISKPFSNVDLYLILNKLLRMSKERTF